MKFEFKKATDRGDAEYLLDETVNEVLNTLGKRSDSSKFVVELADSAKVLAQREYDRHAIERFDNLRSFIVENYL